MTDQLRSWIKEGRRRARLRLGLLIGGVLVLTYGTAFGAVYYYGSAHQAQGRRAQAKENLHFVNNCVDDYFARRRVYPTSSQQLLQSCTALNDRLEHSGQKLIDLPETLALRLLKGDVDSIRKFNHANAIAFGTNSDHNAFVVVGFDELGGALRGRNDKPLIFTDGKPKINADGS